MWKRTLLSLLIPALSLATTAGCASEPTEQKLEFWTIQLKPTFNDYINGMIAKFEKDNPTVKIEWVDVPISEMEKKALAAIAGGQAPDVVNLNPIFASKLAELNALVSMDEKAPANVKESFFPTVWQASSLNGKAFGLPWYLATSLTFYNKELFQKAGLDPAKPPQTYAELAQMGRQIKQKAGKYAMMPNFGDKGEFLKIFVQEGVSLLSPDGKKAAFNTPKGQSVLKGWADLCKEGVIPRESVTQTHRESMDLFQSGQSAIMAGGPQLMRIIKENAPKLHAQLGVGPQLMGEAGLVNVSVMNLVVPAASDRVDDAVKFASFVTNAENQLAFSKIVPVFPSVKKAAEDSFFTQKAEKPTLEDLARQLSATQLPKATALVPPMKQQADLNKAIDQAVQAAFLGKKSPADALAEAEQKWNELLAKP